jgi:5-methylcytosine-specific restriction endonuclease McrBC regulatory subunit McrC
VEVIEYGQAVILEIGQSEAEAISESSVLWQRRLKLKVKPFLLNQLGQNTFSLEARGVAGFIRIGKITLEIAPKFLNRDAAGPNWRSAMWRFLAYGRGIEVLSQTSGRLGVEEGIADVLADIFLTSLKGASIRGYPLGYQPRRLDSLFVSGRLDPKKYSRLLPVTGKIGIITTKLTNDIPTNRLLKWAGLELARTVESPARRKQLNLWATELPHVSAVPPRIEQVPPTKHQFPHLVHAVEIAKLLYEDRKAGYNNGDVCLPGFLWDSDDLFERATRRLLSEAARPLGFNASKRSHTLAIKISTGSETSTLTTPDIDIWRGERSVFIVDSKYKNLGRNPSNEDFYQILAAGRVRAVPTVALLYPATGTGVTDRTYKPQGGDYPMTVLVTTIGLESFASRSRIRSLRDEVTNWICAATSIPTP